MTLIEIGMIVLLILDIYVMKTLDRHETAIIELLIKNDMIEEAKNDIH